MRATTLRVALVVLVALVGRARAERPSFARTLTQHAFAIAVDHDLLTGPGADVLRAAIDDAQFVMLGEDHGIAQIPPLAGALCTELAPHGFHRLALEVGPSVGPELARMAAAADGAAQLAAFDARFPETIAFYTWKEELAFLQTCARATGATPLEIWGVDQELMGASGLVLHTILDSKPGPDARAAIAQLAHDNDDDRAAAVAAGDFGKLFMLAAAQPTLDAAAALLARQATPAAQALFAALLRSRTIYQGQSGATPYASNRERARLMKETFIDDVSAAAGKDKALPKVLLKLGAWHLYRGVNPLYSSELGNLVAEAAEGHRARAVNLLVLGVKGTQLHVVGPGKPAEAAPLDLARGKGSEMKFLAPLFAHQVAGGWTLFDLRPFREHLAAYAPLDRELERLVVGYDFVILIPDPRAESPTP